MWWGAVLVAVGATTLCAVVDRQVNHGLGTLFHGGYAVGCVAAVLLVRRRNLFGPMAQPPLVLAFAVGAVTLPEKGFGPLGVLAAGQSLVDSYWVLVGTTVAVLVLGVLRLVLGRSAGVTTIPEQRRAEEHEPSRAE